MKKIFSKVRSAFTMAEILLSLTIIGVVAAITLPSLTGNVNERVWNTQKKAFYARVSQAFPLVDAIDTHENAEGFITEALNKVTKINNICSQANLADCGVNTTAITLLDGTTSTFPANWSDLGVSHQFSYSVTGATSDEDVAKADANNAQVAAFETGNGETVVLYYNPECIGDLEESPNSIVGVANGINVFERACVNIIYDLNAAKGPNAVGKDIGFITVFHASSPVVAAPLPDNALTTLSVTVACDSDYRLPNKFEAASMALNHKIMSASDTTYLTATRGASSGSNYTFSQDVASLKSYTTAGSIKTGTTRCVKR